jgi:copper chaperone CopZ
MVTKRVFLALMVAAVVMPVGLVQASEPVPTVMSVGEMCGGCVKRITAKLAPMDGIARVECSIERKSVSVVPAAGRQLSPQAIWDAMAQIGKTPVQLVGPSGTFSDRPPF